MELPPTSGSITNDPDPMERSLPIRVTDFPVNWFIWFLPIRVYCTEVFSIALIVLVLFFKLFIN